MRRLDYTEPSQKASFKESAINDLKQEKGHNQSYIDGVKSRILSIDLGRTDSDCSHKKAKGESKDSFDLFRMIKQGTMGFIKELHESGLIDKEVYKEIKSNAKQFFSENKKDMRKLFSNISQRDLESQMKYMESLIANNGRANNNINYEQEDIEEDPIQEAQKSQSDKTNNDGKNLELTLTSTLKLNNIGNSLLNLLNKVDPFSSLDEVNAESKTILDAGIENIHGNARDLILSLDPSLKEDLEAIDIQAKANPDKEEDYLDYSVAMVPIDMASKAIDVVNNEREGFQELADTDRKTLSADMLDFYEYLTNLKENL